MALKILYIEDETKIRDNVSDILGLYGYEVATAGNGRDGIIQAILDPPDLIICDIRMPEMDGYQVLEVIRSNRSLATIPFIFLTARTEELDVRRGMVSGADDYLKKPFTMDSLLQAIEGRLEREAQRKTDLKNRLEAISQMIASVTSNEYNTALNGILGLVSLLINHYHEYDQEDNLFMLTMIKVNGLRLKRSLDNRRLMDELRNLEPAHSAYSFYTLGTTQLDTRVIEQSIRSVNERYDQEITVRLAVETTRLALPEWSLNIILAELIDNAHKFSEGFHPIEIIGHPQGTNYQLTVLNQGLPFTPEDRTHILSFLQVDRQQYDQQGDGLGLAIVNKLLELNQGTLAIETRPDATTAVTVTFQGITEQAAFGSR
ncbi:histidine kinase/DNA gyrase B/HSP90-like ATPase [Larkinella arboricola]|uniref:Histidine kinase/DNA gyrase B/HSP90-like ATPase n=1 Tax=Larkinella arboricola TaxID=643671 RepID=A0A327WQX6_LARAB|nr:response regulator [Larkinella arboricola]RAJ90869.1 histidine kinase/DNA gyrase B/HSP90-like ATPase [Larkinella arboricola]